ncbi:DNA (cytosine-5)-methyltransferase 1 [Candidatus Termititenax persephonae]|uniref:DNA (cytosine-5-)-methyltransferase n=1 Tax=Candidatus Termititenax persephonae TaxID=2218525 RepID=A0A388TGV0_9BACT|nr:DNA (cytosine-5)-methyltransferase 1 [Candidatus Termititenax persephonae]
MGKQIPQLKAKHQMPVLFSFFSGSGFLDLGFENEGFEVAFVNEISPAFLEAYKYSRTRMGLPTPKYGYYNLDINAFLNGRKKELLQLVDTTRNTGSLVGFIGGPPCPDFSVAGKNKGARGVNGKLSLAYVNIITGVLPDFFLFENVKGLWSTVKHRIYFEKLKLKLHKAGYVTSERLCNALEFGVPQDRERVLLFGIRNELLVPKDHTGFGEITNFPWQKFTKYDVSEVKKNNWMNTNDFGKNITPSLADAMKQITVQYWFDKNDVEHHPNAKSHFQPRKGIIKMQTVREGDVSRKSYKRLHRYRYSPTVAYGNNEVHLHPYKERRISAAEALAIQSLPKEFELPQSMSLSNMFKTIGNGVPFLLSNGIAKTIHAFLKDNICKK